MTQNVELVLEGFLNLSDLEKHEFIEVLNTLRSDKKEQGKKFAACKRILNQKQASVVLGPLGQTCPCCGR
ncbi:hypothetical protein FACS1894170_09530 [Planctomycetales bacterium]|nr:hypothetical protein FACS1894170_09530 [Planctomycetales bacterium]